MRLVRLTPLDALLALLFVASILIRFIAPSIYTPQQPLHPYVTVITDRDPADAESLLAAAGVQDIISASSTMVGISRFSGVELVPLDQIIDRMDPLDPRLDPWITGLGSYFTFDGHHALYARLDMPLARADRFVRRTLGAGSRIAEWSLFRSAAGIALFAMVCTALVASYGRQRLRLVPALLPWIPMILAGGLAAATVACMLVTLIAWIAREAAVSSGHGSTLVRELLRSRSRLMLFGMALVASGVYLVRLGGWGTLVTLSIAVVGAMAGTLFALANFVRDPDPDHRPFVPVSIIERGGQPVRVYRFSRLALVFLPLLLLGPPILDAAVPGGSVSRPVPEGASEGGIDYVTLRTLWEARSTDPRRLPDLSDYLAHRAYQDGLLYGRPYGFPAPNEVIDLERFREGPDGAYTSYEEPVFTYDALWVRRTLEAVPQGVASMLVGIGSATALVLAPNDTLYSGYPRFLQHLVYVVLILSPFLFALLPWRRLARSRGIIVDLARRRKQVA